LSARMTQSERAPTERFFLPICVLISALGTAERNRMPSDKDACRLRGRFVIHNRAARGARGRCCGPSQRGAVMGPEATGAIKFHHRQKTRPARKRGRTFLFEIWAQGLIPATPTIVNRHLWQRPRRGIASGLLGYRVTQWGGRSNPWGLIPDLRLHHRKIRH